MKKTSVFFLAFMLSVAMNASAQSSPTNNSSDLRRAQTQKITISGKVLSETGEPMPGVNVVEKGTTNGTTTNLEGKYSFIVNANAIIVASFTGYTTQEIAIQNKTVIDIQLAENTTALGEIVVTAYGTSNQRDLIGSAKKVDNKILQRTAAASFETSLQGNTTGVNVFTTGQPGGSSKVQIRGIGSINGLTQPLYVLDGVVMNSDNNSRIKGIGAVNKINPLSTINSDDIESITVLKDAAAASLYGSRAANGVIVITTKKGKSGETELSFSSEYGFTQNLTGEDLVTNNEFKSLWLEGQLHQYIQNNENGEFKRVYNDAALFSDYQAKAKTDYEKVYGTTDANSDWLDAIYRNGSSQKYNLSARGGNERTKFFISGGYLKQNGTILKSDYTRYSGRANVENKAKSWLRLGTNLSISKSSRNTGQYDGTYAGGLNPLFMARVLPPAAPIYDPEGYKGIANLPNSIEKNANPIGMIEVGKYLNNEFRVRGNAYAEASFLKDFKFKSTLGIDHQTNEETLYDNKEFGAGGGKWNGVVYVSQGEAIQYTSSNLLTYDKIIDKHSFRALVGAETQVSKMKSINNSGYDILDNELLSSSSIGTLWSWRGKSEDYGLISYFSQLSYNYDEKYYLSASYRRDGSSRFGKDSRWGDFWSVSGGWILSEEDFLASIEPINFLKLRASYGTNGNLPPEYYASLAYFNSAKKSYGGSSGLSYGQLGNPELSWELSNNFNVGFDIEVIERINMSVEYFSKQTKDLLLDIPLSGTTGFTSQLQNFGEMKNTGWEVALGYKIFKKKDFTWQTQLNLTMLQNEVTKLEGDLTPTYSSRYGQTPTIIKEGESMNSFYLRDYAGVNKETGLAQYHVLKDGERTGEITTDAKKAGFGIFGKALHDAQGGFYNQFTYKRVALDFLFTFGIGGKVYNRTAFLRDDDGYKPQYTNTKASLNPWNPNNTNSDIPIRINGNSTFSNDVSTRHLYSANYLKLRNLKISYAVPSYKFLRGASVYIQGDNLFLSTELDDYDPEAISNGINFFQSPTARSIVLGFQLKF